jgi:hypothetical protein
MNNEQTVDSGSHGIRWGLIIGITYAVLVFLRYRFGTNNVMLFSILTFFGFVITIGFLFFSGWKLRQQNGGWIEMREAFKAMFIAVLIFEAFFMGMTLLYLKYIDPNFFEKLRESTETMLLTANTPQGDIDNMLNNMDQLQTQYNQINFFDFLKTYLYSVGITGLFALLFAFILKRKPPVFHQENFLQS